MSQAESFRVTPLDATFGATVTGLTLADIDDATFARLYHTWLHTDCSSFRRNISPTTSR